MMDNVKFYIAIIASAIFVYESNKDKTFLSRFFITVSSAGLGFSVAPELSSYVGGSLTLTGILITALGFLVLEVLFAIISDVTFIKKLISKKVGGGE